MFFLTSGLLPNKCLTLDIYNKGYYTLCVNMYPQSRLLP